MQQREKVLLSVLGAAVILWWGRPIFFSRFIEPIEQRQNTLNTLRDQKEEKELQELGVLRATGQMTDYRQQALPPGAFDAQRVYTIWLSDLLDECDWDYQEVIPGKTVRYQDQGSAVQVRIDGLATSQHLAHFLAGFEASGILHRLERISIQPVSHEPDSLLTISLVAEALSLQASERKHLGDINQLASLPEVWEKFAWESPFTKKRNYVAQPLQLALPDTIAIERGQHWMQKLSWSGFTAVEEPVSVTIEGTTPPGLSYDAESRTLIWPTTDETPVGEFPVKLAVVSESQPERKLEKTVTLHVRVPNTPPTLAELPAEILYPNEPWTAYAVATDKDVPQQQLIYALAGTIPPGLQIDSRSGLLQWTPAENLAGQTFPVSVRVTDTGSPPLKAEATLSLSVKPDEERSTHLIACIQVDGVWTAWFREKNQQRRFAVKEGDVLTVGRYQATLSKISVDRIQMKTDEGQQQLQLGQLVSERTPFESVSDRRETKRFE